MCLIQNIIDRTSLTSSECIVMRYMICFFLLSPAFCPVHDDKQDTQGEDNRKANLSIFNLNRAYTRLLAVYLCLKNPRFHTQFSVKVVYYAIIPLYSIYLLWLLCSSAVANHYLLVDAAKNGLKAVKSLQTVVWCEIQKDISDCDRPNEHCVSSFGKGIICKCPTLQV